MESPAPTKHALEEFEKHGGVMKTSDALACGISKQLLYRLRDEGKIVKLQKGLYQLADLDSELDSDLITIAHKIPRGVLCLISALDFHGLTTEIPHRIYLALPYSMQKPHLSGIRIQYHWFSESAYSVGIQNVQKDSATIRVYNPAKTVTDCFKFRNQIGLDVAVAALRDYLEQGGRPADLAMYAEVNRVSNVIRPYVEAHL